MTSDQFTELFKYMNEQFTGLGRDMDDHFTRLEKRVDSNTNAIDGLYDHIDSLHLEYTATTSHQRRIQSQLNQHNTRITKPEQA